MKIVLWVTGILALLVILVVGGAVLWFRHNEGRLREMGRSAMAEGRAFGARSSPEACVAEALRRLEGQGLLGEVGDRIFLTACLSAAPAAPATCAGVPAPTEIMASARWRVGACTRAGRPDDQACGRVLAAVQDHCTKASAAAAP